MNKILITAGLVIAVVLLIFPFIIYYGNDIMIVTSDSMIPTLNPNDLLIVQRTGIDKIIVGDIIAFNSHIEDFGIVAHRVVEIFDDDGRIAIHTRGDNVDEADTWIVHEEDLVGKVAANISFIGILLVEPIRYTLIIVIIITGVSLLREISIERTLQKNK